MSRKNFQVLQGNNGAANELAGRLQTQELNRVKNMFVKDMQVKLRIKNDSKSNPFRIISGTIIQKNTHIIAVRTSTRVESFAYEEFFIGRVKVIS